MEKENIVERVVFNTTENELINVDRKDEYILTAIVAKGIINEFRADSVDFIKRRKHVNPTKQMRIIMLVMKELARQKYISVKKYPDNYLLRDLIKSAIEEIIM